MPQTKPEAPYVSTIPFRTLRSSTVERVGKEYSEFLRAVRAENLDRERLYENFKIYWGIDYGQWSPGIVQQLLDENRHPITINLLSQKINTLAGAIITNQYDVDFIPVNGDSTSLTTAFKDIYIADKHMMKWDASFVQCAKFGLIYQGVEQLYVDRRYDPEGNMAWRIMQPGFVVFTPDWKTDFSEDCDTAWVMAYKTIDQIASQYDVHPQELRTEMIMQERLGQYFGTTDITLGQEIERGTPTASGSIGGLKRVIEKHHMVRTKTRRLVDVSRGYNGLPFPVMHPEKDREYLIAWGNANNVNWEYVRDVPYEDRILKIYTFIPEITYNREFENRPGEVQIQRLDLFPWSADRLNGKNRGIIDLCKDAQQTFNKHQSQKTHMINSAANGATIFNENLTNGDAGKLDDIKKNKNNPSYVNDADLDGVERTHIVMKDKPYDPALFNNEKLMVDLLDIVTPVPAAMSSRTESAKESGILYQSKVAIAEIGMKILYEGLKQHQLDKASGYYLQVQNTYRNNYRKFLKPDKTGFIEINRPIMMGSIPVIINNISQLPRCQVVVKEEPQGLINRHMNRIMFSEMLNNLPPELTLIRSWLAIQVAKTMDTNDQDSQQLEVIAAMEMAKAISSFKSQVLNNEAMGAQAQMMIAQIEQQLGGAVGAGGEAPMQATPQSEMPVEPEMGAEEPPPLPSTSDRTAPDLSQGGVQLLE